MSDTRVSLPSPIAALLRSQAGEMLTRLSSGEAELARAIMTLPASDYTDPARFAREIEQVFRRLPLMLAASCELVGAGAYKTLDVAGIPVLLIRDRRGAARAFLNICPHRASRLATGCGRAARLTCPYHGWSFGPDGRLLAIASGAAFGATDKSELGLTPLALVERYGLIWVILDPAAPPDFAPFLGEFSAMLGAFGFEHWHLSGQRMLPGANWKLALDAHLEFYHLPVLHRATFGTGMSNLAHYFYHGPHVRLGSFTKPESRETRRDLPALAEEPPEGWPMEAQLFGEWVLFPNVSINSFYKSGRSVIISQIFPGAAVGESMTVQTWLHESPPDAAQRAKADELEAFLAGVVGGEDLPMSRDQQAALVTGLVDAMRIGRNEGGVQHAHRWIAHAVARPHGQTMAEWLAAGPEVP